MKEQKITQELLLADENAVENNEPTTAEVTETEITVAENPKDKVFAVSEIEELRAENKKVFQMSDGMHQAVFYPEPVHIFDAENGRFEEIDNNLDEEEDGRHYRNRKGGFEARFSREENNDELFSVAKGIHRIKIFANKNHKEMNHGVMPELIRRKHKDTGVMQHHSLKFANAVEGADYEYSVNNNGVKENIIINEKSAIYRYPFLIECDNLVANHNEETRQISFCDVENGDEVFNIPAPFMTDAAGELSNDVFYEFRTLKNGKISLSVCADSDWINSDQRIFPVTIDPQVVVNNASVAQRYSWCNGIMSTTSNAHTIGTVCGSNNNTNIYRMYMQLTMPELPPNARMQNAVLTLCQSDNAKQVSHHPILALHQVNSSISTGTCSPEYDSAPLDFTHTDFSKSGVSYSFNITKPVDEYYSGDIESVKLMLKFHNEDNGFCDTLHIDNSGIISTSPKLAITYEPTFNAKEGYRTHTHDLGRFGHGSVDIQCGNLMFDFDDFVWNGQRMPATISHHYNSVISDYQYTTNTDIQLYAGNFSNLKIGNGWKMNTMQSIIAARFYRGNTNMNGYIYIDSDGNQSYYIYSAKTVTVTECVGDSCTCNTYNLYIDAENKNNIYDPVKNCIYFEDETTHYFDESGRLIYIKDKYDNYLNYLYSNNKLTSVADGVGREFWLTYDSNNRLINITAPDSKQINYGYDGDYLTLISCSDGRKLAIEYLGNKPSAVILKNSADEPIYKVAYEFTGNRVTRVSEYGVEDGNFVLGSSSTYSYSIAANRTLVTTTEPMDEESGETADTTIYTVYAFDGEGNVVSEYSYTADEGNVGISGDGAGINPYFGEDVTIKPCTNNLLLNHSFTSGTGGLSYWTKTDAENFSVYTNDNAKFTDGICKNCVVINSSKTGGMKGIYQTVSNLTAGTYTFSAYVRIKDSENTGSTCLRVETASGTFLGLSDRLRTTDNEHVRLSMQFEITEDNTEIKAQILLAGVGIVRYDAPQLEKCEYTTDYNYISDSGFENGLSEWTPASTNCFSDSSVNFNGNASLRVVGNIEQTRKAYQRIYVNTDRTCRETFTLSGWAKGRAIVPANRGDKPTPSFCLKAVIKYNDKYYKEYGEEVHTAEFSPYTDEWQYVSMQFAKSEYRIVEYIDIYCEYSYNAGNAYFDDISLVRDFVEYELTAEDYATVEDEPEETEDTEETTATDKNDFSEVMDKYGNTLTETNFKDGELGTIYGLKKYVSDCNCQWNAGNDLIGEVDARGNETRYVVNTNTSRNTLVYDRCNNLTEYFYDSSNRVNWVRSKNDSNEILADVKYSYDEFDNLTEITRGDGMKYSLAYNAFHKLESIGIDGKTEKLNTYSYKNGNGRLKGITYANGHNVKMTYNGYGQIMAEKWYSATGDLIADYKYTYDGDGNIARSIDILSKKEYTYIYERGRITKAVEFNVVINSSTGLISSRTAQNTIFYFYDSSDKLRRKKVVPASGTEIVYKYDSADDDSSVMRIQLEDRTITTHSKNDSFGRKEFDELQFETGYISRKFDYCLGKPTQTHIDEGMVKSTATTQLVSNITYSNGRTISYEYDNEERITSVTDSIDGTTTYTYDALGQLTSETYAGVTTLYQYDNYGNIIAKGISDGNCCICAESKVEYTYGDGVWKDLLTEYDGQAITYDAQGNPLSYLGNNLVWEKGRQLKSFGTTTYTYNANGIRTSKKVNGVTHTYLLDGTKVLQESWSNRTLAPMYDHNDEVCGIAYNGTPYYFVKNLQGDIIEIINSSGTTIGRYSYNAWGKCTITYNGGYEVVAVNPYRYRGYYYDNETGLYYLQSRYYDPETGRFLNGDEAEFASIEQGVLGHNLFAYCENDAVNNEDSTGYLGFKDLWDAIKNSFKFIKSIAEQAYYACQKTTPIKQIKKLSKQSGKSQRQIMRELKKLADDSERCFKHFKIAGRVISILSIIIFALSYLKQGKSLFADVYALIVDLFVEAASWLICEIAERACRLIPACGIIVGFGVSWFIGTLISEFFTASEKKKMSRAYAAKIKKSKQWYDWFFGLFTSVSAAF